MASWNDPPALGCVVAADRIHDWQWVRAGGRRGLWAWLAPSVLRCASCHRPPSDPWAQPNPAEVAGEWADRAPTREHPARPPGVGQRAGIRAPGRSAAARPTCPRTC